MLSHRRW
jgi:hypothetical protein